MSSELRIGNRVRITGQRPVHGYPPGSRGTVAAKPKADASGRLYYSVSMDKDKEDDSTIFLADEIELVE